MNDSIITTIGKSICAIIGACILGLIFEYLLLMAFAWLMGFGIFWFLIIGTMLLPVFTAVPVGGTALLLSLFKNLSLEFIHVTAFIHPAVSAYSCFHAGMV